jgi:LPS-assembly protein
MRHALAATLTVWLALAALPTDAQEADAGTGGADPPALLVADRVSFDETSRVVAEGNVEVVQGDTRMTARRIVYDAETRALTVDGPIRLTLDESTVLLSSQAEISEDLRDGILRSARLVLARQTQLAAAEARRIDGRFTRLDRVVASSCEVCAANPIPLWQIRASRVVRDEEELQIYFDDARFEIYGVPVFYLPRLRLPDPSLERARGVLVPSVTDSSRLGLGGRLPYFLPLGPSRDLTLTPYLAEKARTLEWRYRQAFRRGQLQAEGAFSNDDLTDDPRAYLFANGLAFLPDGYVAGFDIQSTSDNDYLRDYGYSSNDRLASSVFVLRYAGDTAFEAEIIGFESLRFNENNQTQPFLVGDITWDRRFRPAGLGGLARLTFSAHGHERRSNEDVVGRDVGRLTAEADWRRSHLAPGGILLSAGANLLAEYGVTSEDSTYPDPVARILPRAELELRWPWSRYDASGRTHLIQPVAQLAWTAEEAAEIRQPRDESTQFELDEGNLFALSRFPAGDAVEAGLRANLGLSYSLRDASGWSLDATAGRILRAEDLGQFDGITALDGIRSDWLVGLGVGLGNRLSVVNRALFDEAFAYDSFETRLAWRGDRLDLAASYTWLAASEPEGRPDPTTEWQLDGAWRINERWSADADWLYDLRLDRSAEAEIALEYRANCVTVDFGVRRQFTSADQTEPATDFTIQITPAGFGVTRSGGSPRNRACTR